MTIEIEPGSLNRFINKAREKTMHQRGGNIDRASGGNYDDAYYLGLKDGDIYMARTILTVLGIDYGKTS